jgi:hypothetical protein
MMKEEQEERREGFQERRGRTRVAVEELFDLGEKLGELFVGLITKRNRKGQGGVSHQRSSCVG